MAWQPERSTVNQRLQIGPESTSALGTPVAATKLLECFDWQFGINGDINTYTPTGHKYATEQTENTEWVDGTLGGNLDFNGILYPLAGVCGATTPTAAGSSTTAKQWTFTPPTTGSVVPQTYSVEQGDSTYAHSMAYLLFSQFGYTATRSAVSCSGKTISHPISTGITMTDNPTAVPMAPVAGKQYNVYLDPTSEALGTTQLTKALSIDYTMDSVYNPFWPMNRSNIGFTSHVDVAPSCTVKILLEADAVGMGLLNSLQVGSTQFLRVEAVGAVIDADNTINNTITHDMAIKIGKPNTFSDNDGVFAIEWDCPIVEDPTWGMAQQFVVTNLITAL
jgi:hypothetical protein